MVLKLIMRDVLTTKVPTILVIALQLLMLLLHQKDVDLLLVAIVKVAPLVVVTPRLMPLFIQLVAFNIIIIGDGRIVPLVTVQLHQTFLLSLLTSKSRTRRTNLL